MEFKRPASRLYLVTPALADAGEIAPRLAEGVEAADVAAVLVRFAARDERARINIAKALAPVAQRKGVAVILDGAPEIVARAGADGAHMTGIDAFTEALPLLKPDRIAGCGGLDTRHDAMLAGEAGADYVLFGDPHDGSRAPLAAILEQVSWWAEIFETPCVAFAESLDEVGELVRAGAEFVAVGDFIFADPRGVAIALAEAEHRLVGAQAGA